MGMGVIVFRKTKFIGIDGMQITVHLHHEQHGSRNNEPSIGHGADLEKRFGPPPFEKQCHHDAQRAYLPQFDPQVERENPEDNAVFPQWKLLKSGGQPEPMNETQ